MDLNKGLSERDLDVLIGDRDYLAFLNSRNELFRERDMKNHPPSRKEAIALMAKNPNLIKRPILVREDEARDGKHFALGFDENRFKELTGA